MNILFRFVPHRRASIPAVPRLARRSILHEIPVDEWITISCYLGSHYHPSETPMSSCGVKKWANLALMVVGVDFRRDSRQNMPDDGPESQAAKPQYCAIYFTCNQDWAVLTVASCPNSNLDKEKHMHFSDYCTFRIFRHTRGHVRGSERRERTHQPPSVTWSNELAKLVMAPS